MTTQPLWYAFEIASGDCLFASTTTSGHVNIVAMASDGAAGLRFDLTPDEADQLATNLRLLADRSRERCPEAQSNRRAGS